jgi:hypothetical protein
MQELGINAIELMPSHEFNELEYYAYNPVMGDYKMNFWGYSSINFFSPMTRYAAAGIRNCGRDAINEFKTLVREAHKLGIEASNSQIMLLHQGYVNELFLLCFCIATIYCHTATSLYKETTLPI